MSFPSHPTWVEVVQMAMIETDIVGLELDILTVVGYSPYHSKLLRNTGVEDAGDFVVVKKSKQVTLSDHIFIVFVSNDGIALAEQYTGGNCAANRFDLHEPDALEKVTDMFQQAVEHPEMTGHKDLGLSIMWRLDWRRS